MFALDMNKTGEWLSGVHAPLTVIYTPSWQPQTTLAPCPGGGNTPVIYALTCLPARYHQGNQVLKKRKKEMAAA